MFDLTRPCSDCPFRPEVGGSFRLEKARLLEIINGPAFQCHQTYSWYSGRKPKIQQCYGLLAVLAAEGRENTIMQVASRLGCLNLDALSTALTYKSINEVLMGHFGQAVEKTQQN